MEAAIYYDKKKLYKSAIITLKQCLVVKPDEKLLIVANPNLSSIAFALFEAGSELAGETRLIFYQNGDLNGEEPPVWVAEAMTQVDVVIAVTFKSISHTIARQRACNEFDVRIATMPGITEDVFIRGLSADYSQIEIISKKLQQKFDNHKKAYITSPSGTDLTVVLGNKSEICDGKITEHGAFSNLPDGEVGLAPCSANGIIVVDRCGDYITEPTYIKIKNGYLIEIENNSSGQRFQRLIDEAKSKDKNNNAEFIAEFAIGTNPEAKVSGIILEDEKVLGTCHFAFGNNTSYDGGRNYSIIHIDVIVFAPTIIFDSEIVMKKGNLIL